MESIVLGEIKRSVRQRGHYSAKAGRSNNYEDWFLHRSQRSRVTNLIRDYKNRYSRKLIEESKNPKAFWKTMKKVLTG